MSFLQKGHRMGAVSEHDGLEPDGESQTDCAGWYPVSSILLEYS